MLGTLAQRLGRSVCAFFIACLQRSRSVPKPAKQNLGQSGDHSSVRDSLPMAFSGYPRGPRVGFQMLGVEAHPSLPHDQHNGGNLPRQGQPGHFRSYAPGQQFRIEFREGTGLSRGDHRRTFEQILQIVIVISVQPANLDLLLVSVRAVLSQGDDQRCCWFRCRHRHRSTAAAWCGTGAGSAECQAIRLTGSDRSRGSGKAASTPCVFCSPRADPPAPPGADIAAHRVAGSKTPPAGAPRVH